jgi:hypothetical protein
MAGFGCFSLCRPLSRTKLTPMQEKVFRLRNIL